MATCSYCQAEVVKGTTVCPDCIKRYIKFLEEGDKQRKKYEEAREKHKDIKEGNDEN